MKNYNQETVLLTWTLKPNSKVSEWIFWHKWCLKPEERQKDYFYSILYYIIYSNFKNIVFCENSNYEFWNFITILKQLAKYYNKNLEIIQFQWNIDKVLDSHYWYWEWEITNYALENSKILQKSTGRYKITWRYIVENINDIIKFHKNDKNLFFRFVTYSLFSLNTMIFKISKKDYNKYLKDINNKLTSKILLETLYYKTLKNTDINIWQLKVKPYIIRRDYKSKKIKFFHKILFKIWCRSYNSNICNILEQLKNFTNIFRIKKGNG